MWKQWINALLGVGVIIVPFLGLSAVATTWTFVVMGAVVIVLSLWVLGEVSSKEYQQLAGHHSRA